MKNQLKDILQKADIKLSRFSNSDLSRRIKIVENQKINILLDVGANEGQYAQEMRKMGYKGKIISFEPLQSAFDTLEKYAAFDPHWQVYHFAIGDQSGIQEINVAANSYSSSFLKILPKHVASASNSKYVSTEQIEVKTLNDLYENLNFLPEDNIMLKIDTQGYEKNVLEGVSQWMDSISLIQLEMSLVPLYENETLFAEMLSYLQSKNFNLFSLENGYSDPESGQLLQVDGVFVNGKLM